MGKSRDNLLSKKTVRINGTSQFSDDVGISTKYQDDLENRMSKRPNSKNLASFDSVYATLKYLRKSVNDVNDMMKPN